MNTSLFGDWDHPRVIGDYLSEKVQGLWHSLAAQGVGTHEFQPNSGMSQKKDQICMAMTMFHFLQPKVVMECGVAQGGTLAAWCALAPPDATIIALDRCLDDCRPRPGEPVHSSIYNGPLRMTGAGGGIYHLKKKGQTMIGINGWTHDPAVQEQVKRALNGRTIDFLHHDLSHSARMTREDMVWMWPLITPGGCMCLHDIQPSKHPDCDKSVAWQEMKETLDYSACYEFLGSRTDDSMGCGLLFKA
jgi:cephalosporin hydroxylase